MASSPSMDGVRSKTVAVIALAMLLAAGLPLAFPAHAFPTTSGGIKNMTLFLHYASAAASPGGVSTSYLADTAATFQTMKNHDSKATGQPKIQLDWYVSPDFAGQISLSGEWQVVVFANSSSLHPATWGLEFWEKSPSGSVVWDSGALTPTVLGGPSGNNGYVDAPIYGYTLTVSSLSHVFAAGNTLEVEVTINTGATVPLNVWYDSAQEPSRMVLRSADYIHISGITTKDANGTLRTVFFTFWSPNQRSVTIQTLVTDPFGGYDINSVTVSIKDPSGAWAISNQTMSEVSGSLFSFNNTYSYSFQYSAGAPKGNYTVTIMALDNNAQNQFAHSGTYVPYAEVASATFSIGLQYPVHVKVFDTHQATLSGAKVSFFSGGVEYATGSTARNGTYNVTLFTGAFTVEVWWEGVPVLMQNVTIKGATSLNLTASVYYPTFRFVDDVQKPVAGALVFVHFPNGSATILPYTAGANGSLSLSQQPRGNYTMLVLFEGVDVAETSVQVTSDGPFAVGTRVFQLMVTVEDSGGSPLNGSSVLVSSPGKANGGAYGYLLTSKSGQANFSLPQGSYVVTAEYHGVYLLSPFSNRTSIATTLNHDTSLLIKMKNLPPPVWLTLGFQLILILVLAFVGVGLYAFLRRRNKMRSMTAKQLLTLQDAGAPTVDETNSVPVLVTLS